MMAAVKRIQLPLPPIANEYKLWSVARKSCVTQNVLSGITVSGSETAPVGPHVRKDQIGVQDVYRISGQLFSHLWDWYSSCVII